MKQLSGLDASFLYLEAPEMPMHVGALHLLELPASYRGSFVADLRRHIAARLPLAQVLCRKLAWMPLNFANPVWVDAQPKLSQHIVAVKLAKGSSFAELEAQVGRLHTELLARDRPLWKFYVFEGLAPGPNKERRYGLYTQVHHAAVDGQAAVALAAAIFDPSPEPRLVKAERRRKAAPAGMVHKLGSVLANQLQQYANIVKALPSTVGALAQLVKKGPGGLGLAPRTRFNAAVTATRAFAAVSLPMAELKALRRAHDVTLNDLVLLICSGALRRHLQKHPPLPRQSLVAAVPVSTRAAGDTASNNQASITVVKLGTHLADPMKRLLYVKAASASMKETLGSVKNLMPSDIPSLGVPWLLSAAGALYNRSEVASRIPPIANVAISNVPGPAVPLYLAGAKMLSNYPTSIVVHGLALNITVQSYNESLDFGLMACAQALPEVAELAGQVREAFEELKSLPPTALPADIAVSKATAAPRASAPSRERRNR